MTCRELIESLDEYVAGDVSAARLEEFEHHLAHCPSCVEYLKSYRETIRLIRGVFRTPEV